MSTPVEIERRFLIDDVPQAVRGATSWAIRQGYLAVDAVREVRLRMAGSDCFLTVKQGYGLVRQEVETRITREQFEELWPLTEGHRIEKRRHAVRHEGLTIEVDIYEGPLAPLCVAEVEFPSVEASERFVPLEYFGAEITDRRDFRNSALALHGLPVLDRVEHRIGALPYLFKHGSLHVVLVTSFTQSRWILPKGNPEKNMSQHEVALMESVEEAGVMGTVASGMRAQCKLKDGTLLHVYPLLVSTVLQKWPEASHRKRRILPLARAVALIRDRELAECVERLGARILETDTIE